MPRRYLVTSGLPYSNGRLHVGHIAGAYLPADTYVRFLRARGDDALFICGSDDNGVAIEISARKAGTTPAAVSSHFNARQKADFAGLRIDFDVFGGTHQPGFADLHTRISQEFFKRIFDQGCFTKRTTKQLYDPVAKRFLPDRYVRGICHHCKDHETYGDQCEKTGAIVDPLLLINPVSQITPGQAAEVRETTHWYLRLAEFEKPLAEWLQTKQGQWRPHVLNFALGQIKNGLPERAMTRDIDWGIPVPLDDPDAKGKVLFVWFDAPIGYVSFTAQLLAGRGGSPEDYRKWWADPDSAIVHFIGEDNTVFHALIWPAMLMAEGRHQLPSYVVANNFVNLGDAKVSKSQTAPDSPVWVEEFLKRFDPDTLRFYLTHIAPETSRTSFDPADFVNKVNSVLVSKFGNFVNRYPKFLIENFGGRIPDAKLTEADQAQLAAAGEAMKRIGELIEGFRFRAAMDEFISFVSSCDLYIGQRAPWKSRKTDLADTAACIATCANLAHHLAIMAWPFMPGASERLLKMLNAPPGPIRWTPPPPFAP
ncbi:MAG: methionine--tRNA ligase, partial [Planctomycetes bacterium]|nr:methionine--tRNA ligase [Planctomycetota bacterium]